MSDDTSAPGIHSNAGYWDSEVLELAKRFFYRPEFHPLLLEYLGANGAGRILDVGCGTGYLARLLASSVAGASVVGVDGDEKMLTLAEQILEQEGLSDRIELVRSDAYRLPFADGSFDLTTSHTLLCIMTDPEAALREQIRVTRKGGVVSAVVCFCHTDNLPHYHGRAPLPGNHRINLLAYRLWQVWRQTVRPRLLTINHTIVNQDLAWLFRHVGLEDIQVNGYLRMVAPGDDRIPIETGGPYAIAMQRSELKRIERWRADHSEELADNGFSEAEFDELLALKRARLAHLEEDPARVREVMEVITDPLIMVRGTRPTEA